MQGLNRNQLKFIAICGMVCDHIAWGFVDFMSPLGQVMHVIGRLTIPIMCFFIAEGFRHTSNLRRYIRRMMCFWIISILPFYAFFHELYDYRQNIIFDLLLGLLMLAVLEHKDFSKVTKTLLGTALFVISAVIGGWPILPILYILVFYYAKDFKKQAAWFCSLTVLLEVFLIVAISLNNIWHFSHYDWVWYEKLYFLGFMIPLLLLRHYNGEKGKTIIGKYFFYIFYPAHFLVLTVVREILNGISIYNAYLLLHFGALIFCLAISFKIALYRPSKVQLAALTFTIFASIYTFGFLIEITSFTIGGFFAAIKVEYFGECLLIIGFTWYIREFIQKRIPSYIFAFEIFATFLTLWNIFTFPRNRFFYTDMGVDNSGPFPRVTLTYGTGFYLFVLYSGVISIAAIIAFIAEMKQSTVLEKKRLRYMCIAIICPWFPIIFRELGLTGGYEVPAFGIAAAAFFMSISFIKYGYFDSLSLASENAFNRGTEGVLVIDSRHKVLYFNKRMSSLFPTLTQFEDAYQIPHMKDIFNREIKNLEIDQHVYEMRVDPLVESGYIQGYMLWVLDITEHHNLLMKVNDIANKDPLTGVKNRSFFQQEVTDYIAKNKKGAMFMLDLDNFKLVNDTHGHQAGDTVLIILGNLILKHTTDSCISCRIGGDEFCLFFKEVNDYYTLASIAQNIITEFESELSSTPYPGSTSTSIGIAVVDKPISFEELYSQADKALYIAKNSNENKATYYFYQ